MKLCNNRSRAGKLGKGIYCPYCNNETHVFNFSWASLQCDHCGIMSNKNSWQLEPSSTRRYFCIEAKVLLWRTYRLLGLTGFSRNLNKYSKISFSNNVDKKRLLGLVKNGLRVNKKG